MKIQVDKISDLVSETAELIYSIFIPSVDQSFLPSPKGLEK
jgi:hypothetical protein